jgi:curved DNA-binding protein CbpA
MSDVKPTATGSLQVTPLSNLLVYVLDRQLDGTLVLEDPARARSAIWFDHGSPAKAKTAQPVIYLGRLLLELGEIDEATLNRTLAQVAEQRKLHGQILITEGAIDGATLKEALEEQVARQVTWMFTLPPQTLYGFYEKQNFLERYGGRDAPRARALSLIWRCVRAHAPSAKVEATLARLADKELRLHPDAQLARFHFATREQAVADVLRAKPQKLEALLKSGLDDVNVIRRLIYTLAVTRHFDLGVPGSMPVGVDEPPSSSRIKLPDSAEATERRRRLATGARRAFAQKRSGSGNRPAPDLQSDPEPTSAPGAPPDEPAHAESLPPSGTADSPEVQAFKTEIRQRFEAMSDQDYYTILGVARDAPTSAIQTSFFALAKKWHPDRLGPEYDDVRELATRVFARMSEGHHLLIDETQRGEYDGVLQQGGGSAEEQEQVHQVLRAATNFQKAEVLLKKHNLAGAEEHVRLALEDDPGQADYVALYAWIQSQNPGRERFDDLIGMLNDAVNKEPKNERARYYRGQLLKRTGKLEGAIRDFRWVVDHNPKHLDATRELRLYEMRKSMQPGARHSEAPKKGSDIGGLFKKVFKR